MKFIINIKLIVLIDLLLIIALISLPFYKLYGSSYYDILKVIFIVVIVNSLYLLFISLKKLSYQYEVVKMYFKPFLLTFSIIIIVLIGQLHLVFLNHMVIPDSLYCNYYDEYNYKIYYSDSNGCPELKILESKTNQSNELVYISYEIGRNQYERYYNDKRIVKTIEINTKKIIENLNIPFNQVKIETDYVYEENKFTQQRYLTYYFNDQPIISQNAYYSSTYELKKDGVKIDNVVKSLSNYTLLISDNNFKNLFNSDYLKKYSLISYTPSTYLTYFQSFISDTEPVTSTQIIRWNGGDSVVIKNEEDDQADEVSTIIMSYHNYNMFYIMFSREKQISNNSYQQINNSNFYENGIVTTNNYKSIGYTTTNSLNRDGTLRYMDVSCGNNPIIRHIVYNMGEHIKKIETFDLFSKRFNKNDFDGCSWTGARPRPSSNVNKEIMKNQSYDYRFLPFDFEFTTSEVIETPKPYIVK